MTVNEPSVQQWKEKEDLVPEEVGIRGTGQLTTFRLQADGFHTGLRGDASPIDVDGKDTLSDWFSVIVKTNAFLAVFALLAWLIDKIHLHRILSHATARLAAVAEARAGAGSAPSARPVATGGEAGS